MPEIGHSQFSIPLPPPKYRQSKRFDARTETRRTRWVARVLMLNNNSTEWSWVHNQERSSLLTQTQQYTSGQWRQNARTKLWTKVNKVCKITFWKIYLLTTIETCWFRDCLTVRLWALCKRDSSYSCAVCLFIKLESLLVIQVIKKILWSISYWIPWPTDSMWSTGSPRSTDYHLFLSNAGSTWINCSAQDSLSLIIFWN